MLAELLRNAQPDEMRIRMPSHRIMSLVRLTAFISMIALLLILPLTR